MRVEHIRAEANEELIDTLHEQEMDDSARFDEMQRHWENQCKDPDDIDPTPKNWTIYNVSSPEPDLSRKLAWLR